MKKQRKRARISLLWQNDILSKMQSNDLFTLTNFMWMTYTFEMWLKNQRDRVTDTSWYLGNYKEGAD